MATHAMKIAKKNKSDEYYTQLSDIENELRHYKEQFVGKVILCNCDDPYESNFFKYFAMNFNFLGLRKLIATCYDTSPIAYTQLSFWDDGKAIPNRKRRAYKIEITEVKDYNKDGAIDLCDVEYLLKSSHNSLTLLSSNGDFRSIECVNILKQADIVVTNPPFSLFRDFVAQLVEFNKKFIIIGNKNALTYKEIFPLFKNNYMWLGYRNINDDMWFIVPEKANYEKIKDGKNIKHIMGCWFTNLDVKKRHEYLIKDLQYKCNRGKKE